MPVEVQGGNLPAGLVVEPAPDLDALLVLLVIVVGLAVAAAVAAPLVRPARERDGVDGERLAELEARKEAKYREIRDAELDFRTGKLSRDDHRALDRTLRREALEILEEIEASAAGAKHETLGRGEAPRNPGDRAGKDQNQPR